MDERPIRPRTDLEAAILELYRQLPEPKKRIMMLSAMFSAAHNGQFTRRRPANEISQWPPAQSRQDLCHTTGRAAGGLARKEAVTVAELTYSVTEAAQALGVSRRTMYDLINREDFPTLKVGGRRLISRELLAEWVRVQAGGQKENRSQC